MSCGHTQGCSCFRRTAQPPVALAEAVFLRLTRGRSAAGRSYRVAPLGAVLSTSRRRPGSFPVATLLFGLAVATLLPIRPTHRSKGRCAIKPRNAPELSRWALAGESA